MERIELHPEPNAGRDFCELIRAIARGDMQWRLHVKKRLRFVEEGDRRFLEIYDIGN
jgi:hypothetical protein